jgi:hypothetical protein
MIRMSGTTGHSDTGETRWESNLSPSRLSHMLALHAPRPVALADFFSILLEVESYLRIGVTKMFADPHLLLVLAQ